jgi:hypothetical protein
MMTRVYLNVGRAHHTRKPGEHWDAIVCDWYYERPLGHLENANSRRTEHHEDVSGIIPFVMPDQPIDPPLSISQPDSFTGCGGDSGGGGADGSW